jgi:hypothetical protein
VPELRLQHYGLAFVYQSTHLHFVNQNRSERLGGQFVGLVQTHFKTMAEFPGGRPNLLVPLFLFPGLLLLGLIFEEFPSSYFIRVLLGFFVILALKTD